jgi:hypothetical protein
MIGSSRVFPPSGTERFNIAPRERRDRWAYEPLPWRLPKKIVRTVPSLRTTLSDGKDPARKNVVGAGGVTGPANVRPPSTEVNNGGRPSNQLP